MFITRNTPKRLKHSEILTSTFQWCFLYRVEYQNEIFRVFRPKRYEIDHFGSLSLSLKFLWHYPSNLWDFASMEKRRSFYFATHLICGMSTYKEHKWVLGFWSITIWRYLDSTSMLQKDCYLSHFSSSFAQNYNVLVSYSESVKPFRFTVLPVKPLVFGFSLLFVNFRF